jgi:ribosome-associated toxin RatA of RatAB toxin-antitoxin module
VRSYVGVAFEIDFKFQNFIFKYLIINVINNLKKKSAAAMLDSLEARSSIRV